MTKRANVLKEFRLFFAFAGLIALLGMIAISTDVYAAQRTNKNAILLILPF